MEDAIFRCVVSWLSQQSILNSFAIQVTLLGDAAHPLLPYGSQGATQADPAIHIGFGDFEIRQRSADVTCLLVVAAGLIFRSTQEVVDMYVCS